jgi:hypothetical protein
VDAGTHAGAELDVEVEFVPLQPVVIKAVKHNAVESQ